MANGIDKAIEAAGSQKDLAEFLQITPQAVHRFKRKGWLPVDRARAVADRYEIPFADLVRSDIRAALSNS